MEPRNPDTISRQERFDRCSDFFDEPDHLVTGDDVAAVYGQVAFGDVKVGSAHSAGENPNE
ncbi:hypothetical protein RQCS_60110 (plasmid) [Rhodococcus qingshengii]|nr:hypothetical protein RQCS_60110 [Rhodococcus qingshengii]